MSIFTIPTFTLREIAAIEKEEYQNVLNRKKKGEYVAVSFLSGGKNARSSLRYLSRRMSEIVLTLARERLLDAAVEADGKSIIIAKERRGKRQAIIGPTQFSKK